MNPIKIKSQRYIEFNQIFKHNNTRSFNQFSPQEIYENSVKNDYKTLRLLCEYGNIESFKYIMEKLELLYISKHINKIIQPNLFTVISPLNFIEDFNYKLLEISSRSGKSEIFTYIIEEILLEEYSIPDIGDIILNYTECLYNACRYGHVKILNSIILYLVQYMNYMEIQDIFRYKQYMHLACRYGNSSIVKYIIYNIRLEYCNVHYSDNKFRFLLPPPKGVNGHKNPIDYTCMYGHLNLFKYLYYHLSKIEAVDSRYYLALSVKYHRLDFIKYIIEELQSPIEIELYDYIYHLSLKGKKEIVEYLISFILKNIIKEKKIFIREIQDIIIYLDNNNKCKSYLKNILFLIILKNNICIQIRETVKRIFSNEYLKYKRKFDDFFKSIST